MNKIENNEPKSVVFVDMDHTLSIPSHRDHKLPHLNPNYKNLEKTDRLESWKLYFQGCINDPPKYSTIDLVKELSKNNEIIILTARDYSAYEETKEWLDKFEIPYSDIFMRDIGVESPAPEVKMIIINSWIEKNLKSNIKLILDDDDRNIKIFLENNLPVLKVEK